MSNEVQRASFLKHQARHARQCLREARIVGAIIAVSLTVASCTLYTQGYVPPALRPEQPHLILGIPSWVVWGLAVPWLVMVVVTWWFALFVMKDDEPYIEVPDGIRQRKSKSSPGA